MVEDFLNATREVAKLRWPVPRPALGLPVQRVVGKRDGDDILWPASGVSPDKLGLVEPNGARFHISSVARYITSPLDSESEACRALARHLDWQSEHIRETECQSLEVRPNASNARQGIKTH